jgi:hypothetical protein
MKLSRFYWLGALLLALFSTLAVAQQPESSPISTDRPSIGTGPDLVPLGSIQVESGGTWSRSKGANSFDGPESLIRLGLFNRAEIQITTPNLHWQSDPVLSTDAGDTAFGTKVGLRSGTSPWPLAVVVSFSFPTGSATITSGGVDPTLLLATSHNFAHNLQVSASASLGSASVPQASRVVNSQFAVDLGWNLSPRTGAFIEGAPFVSSADDSNGYSADGGATWALSPRLQLDCKAGATMQNGVSTVFVGFGYSTRKRR